MKRLNVNTPFLKYANEAVLPFYILHQTVIVTLGYFVVEWALHDLLKFIIILGVSFLIVMVLYEFLVQRINALRFLFGMKVRAKSVMPQNLQSQAVGAAQVR
jgi:peptidoglycan/LPS O-acetylase OafA/YrhL